ncbi:MAG: hypothetical protein U1B80_07795 [Anaerolineaceae bacterium]|nr:hypothetical protein [Anaerolineaceae bacterium]
MRTNIVTLKALAAFAAMAILAVAGAIPARAAEEPPEGDGRRTVITIDVYRYEWWVGQWRDSKIVCQAFIEHEGLPTSEEIFNACGKKIHKTWSETPPCNETDTSQCRGVYLYLAGEGRGTREVKVELPRPEAWISISGCELKPPANECDGVPNLTLTGVEPLPNETIVRLNGVFDGEPFSCPGSQCDLPLHPTGSSGAEIEFWADSSFGDASPRFTANVRILPWGDFMAPEGRVRDTTQYTVDVLSSQWKGLRPASCADVWQVFPEVGGPPTWLTTPDSAAQLRSSISYYYLAGMLIQNGMVDASACPNNGLQRDLAATACGVQAALPQVIEWQNRFDAEILLVANETGVPAQLMKNIFSRESQFWPGIFKTYLESGLGQMTEYGADTVLLWNPSFFNQFCPLVLSQATCQRGFSQLKLHEKNMLRGALVSRVNAACFDCPTGIDLSRAGVSVRIFAESLLANCEQTGRIIYNITGKSPGRVSSYIDLWRFTLVNYNAGAGCLANAIQRTWNRGRPLDWRHISVYLSSTCRNAIRYVEDVTIVPDLMPTPTPWFGTAVTPTPEILPEEDWEEDVADDEDWGDEDWEEDEDEDWDEE